MKQFLAPEDLKNAPKEVRTKLVKFCKKNNIYTWKRTAEQLEKLEPDEYNLPLFSIGQLIQYLFEHNAVAAAEHIEEPKDFIHKYISLPEGFRVDGSTKEFIDVLWEAICKDEKHGK